MLYNKLNLLVARFAAKSRIREEVSGVLFRKDRTAATDSFRLLEVSVHADAEKMVQDAPAQKNALLLAEGESIVIPAAPLLAVKFPGPSEETWVDAEKDDLGEDEDDDYGSPSQIPGPRAYLSPLFKFGVLAESTKDSVVFVTGDHRATQATKMHPLEKPFPAYETLFPEGEPQAEVTVNGQYLKELLDAMGEFDQHGHEVTLKIYGDNKPIVLEAETSDKKQKGRALLMGILKA